MGDHLKLTSKLSESQVEDDSPSSPVQGHPLNAPLIMIRPNQKHFDEFKLQVEEKCSKLIRSLVWHRVISICWFPTPAPGSNFSTPDIFESVQLSQYQPIKSIKPCSYYKSGPWSSHNCKRAKAAIVPKKSLRDKIIDTCKLFRHGRTVTPPWTKNRWLLWKFVSHLEKYI